MFANIMDFFLDLVKLIIIFALNKIEIKKIFFLEVTYDLQFEYREMA